MNKPAGNWAENITSQGFRISHWYNIQFQRVCKGGQQQGTQMQRRPPFCWWAQAGFLWDQIHHDTSYKAPHRLCFSASVPMFRNLISPGNFDMKRIFLKWKYNKTFSYTHHTSTSCSRCQTATHNCRSVYFFYLHLYTGGQLSISKAGGLLGSDADAISTSPHKEAS